jgi:hypothetical protein
MCMTRQALDAIRHQGGHPSVDDEIMGLGGEWRWSGESGDDPSW